MSHVALVIVSHSPKVAEGTVEMVRQMVGPEVRVAWCGGDVEGGLGSDVGRIQQAIEQVWSPAGVAVLADLGGAVINSEMAIELLPEPLRDNVLVLDAPLVEGAIVAAAEAASGAALADVKAAAEELTP